MQMFTIALTGQQVDTVMAALARQPLEVSFEVFCSIRDQIAPQRPVPAPILPPPPPDPPQDGKPNGAAPVESFAATATGKRLSSRKAK